MRFKVGCCLASRDERGNQFMAEPHAVAHTCGAPGRDTRGFHFHIRMDLPKNLELPSLDMLLALHMVPQQSDIWAGDCIGVWIASRGLALLTRSAGAFRQRHLRPQLR